MVSSNKIIIKKKDTLFFAPYKTSIPELVQEMNDHSYFPLLKEKLHQAEKEQRRKFHDFNDYEILYYYVHEQKNVDLKKNRKENTRKEYLRELLHFAKNITQYSNEMGIDIEEIKEGSLFKSLAPRHMTRFQEWMIEKAPKLIGKESYSPATISRKTAIIKDFLSFLFEKKYIVEPIHSGMSTATVSKDERPNKDLGAREVIQLLQYFNNENHPIIYGIIHVLVTTGIRNNEFCKARVCDLSYDHVRAEYYLQVDGKGNKKRLVPIKPKVFQSIVEFREMRGLETKLDAEDETPLFVTSEMKPYSPSYLSQYINKAIKRTELEFIKLRKNPIGPHTCRHAFAIISYNSGADIYKIMRSLGHESIETTNIYLQKEFEKDNNAAHMWEKGELAEYI
ncbi:tyrosine-type recombinase/integrase [Bacillus sp. BRMEA1]|uniref:tyrosine-type recombinase/integrase n=1 Tax=Neobacillus endophyticus TaxID=2738405 RepID=UPI00156629A7|nr:tyrosine-type recombinase/integrase [Neobacillus endophyticus]NRD80967.1 tyrosine-type recombinase/integrase [Neobacillus endophyticus]